MSTPRSLLATGSFTSDGTATTLQLPRAMSYFLIKNRSTWGTNPAAVVQSEWFSGYAAGQATTTTESGAGVLSATNVAAGGNGFTAVDESTFAPGAAVAITAITNANPAVVSSATTPAVGDQVRIINPTAMLQVGGMTFDVTAVNPGVTFTLGYLDASGFAAAATGGSYRVEDRWVFLPARRFITTITAANPAVVTTSEAHGYTVGDRVTIYVSDDYGMTQINGVSAEITAVTVSTFTTDIDSSGFTAFAYPTSAVAAAGVTPPHVVPFGEVATALDQPQENDARIALTLGTTVVGANTNVMDWWAFGDDVTI
jgi:hypothetical protein